MKFGTLEVTFGKKTGTKYPQRQNINARYDAAQTNHTNARHWANADGLSADEANNPEVRRVTRNRSRYERANNSYLSGMTETYAENVIGTIPRLQFLDDDQSINDIVETAFNDWATGISLGQKLRTVFAAKVGDGESFLIETTTDKNLRSEVRLNYDIWDAERCTSHINSNNINNIDGVILNEKREVISYTFAKQHPGGAISILLNAESLIEKPADQVIHFFKLQRPEQHRGVTELMAALPLGAKLRSFTLSTIDAAKAMSTFSGVLHTTSGAFDDENSSGGGNGDGFEAFDTFAIDTGMLLTLPSGYDMKQAKPEQPTSTYKEFKREIVAETARSIGMPVNVALGDSSGFNFASGRLDRLSWMKTIKICQYEVVEKILWPMFTRWFEEAVLIEDFFPRNIRNKLSSIGYKPRWTWFFDGDTAIDPVKEAKAADTKLKNLSTNHRIEYAKVGLDYRDVYKQIATEKKERKALGIEMDDISPSTPTSPQSSAEGAQAMAERVAEIIMEEGLSG